VSFTTVPQNDAVEAGIFIAGPRIEEGDWASAPADIRNARPAVKLKSFFRMNNLLQYFLKLRWSGIARKNWGEAAIV
jgi:hypothetical protein